jgi:hypothetical protein
MLEGQTIGRHLRGLSVDLESLPVDGNIRWVARRKAQVVLAISIGLLTFNEACRRYDISIEELNEWRRNFGHAGLNGLKVKNIVR